MKVVSKVNPLRCQTMMMMTQRIGMAPKQTTTTTTNKNPKQFVVTFVHNYICAQSKHDRYVWTLTDVLKRLDKQNKKPSLDA